MDLRYKSGNARQFILS